MEAVPEHDAVISSPQDGRRPTINFEDEPELPSVEVTAGGDDKSPGIYSRSSTRDLEEATPLLSITQHFVYPAEESVYSYLTFMSPIEQRRSGKFITPLICFALSLVFVNFIMQVGLLYVVGQHIMRKHTEWVGSVAKIKDQAWYHVLPMPYNIPEGECRTKDSPLCSFVENGGISCAPPSVQALTDWTSLDIDGDGLWTREEAEDKFLGGRIQCKYNLDLPALYKLTVQNINGTSELMGRQDSLIRSGAAIHKAFMNWYIHKPLICSYGDQDMCGALFERGFFDEALRQRTLPRFKDTQGALSYCTQLLQYECFNILPNTYRVWRFTAAQQCGLKLYDQIDYNSPAAADEGALTPMLGVDFRKRAQYATTQTWGFRLFLSILLVTFLSVMALEMKSIIASFLWCAFFPADRASDSSGGRKIIGKKAVTVRRSYTGGEEEDLKKIILAVRWDHRLVVFIMTLLRFMLWMFLMWTGIMFLTGPPRYLTLIFDALSLVFIFEIDELLYRTMLRYEFQKDHKDIEDMKVPQKFLNEGRHAIATDLGWLIGVIVLSMVIVWTYTHTELDPLLHSLECVCASQGPQCTEAQFYNKNWWDSYWSATMPASNVIINDRASA